MAIGVSEFESYQGFYKTVQIFLINCKYNQASRYPATLWSIALRNLEFKQAVFSKSVQIFQNVFPFGYQVQLHFYSASNID